MTGDKDEHYRPWLDKFDGEDEDSAQRIRKATIDIPKAQDERDPSPAPGTHAKSASDQAAALLSGVKRAWHGFAATTIRWGERADIPRRVAALELGDKADRLGAAISRGAGKAGGAIAAGAATAGKSSGTMIGRAARKTRAATASGLDKSIAATRNGSGRLIAGARDAARPVIAKVAPPKPEAPVIGSELDRLVAEEKAGEATRPAKQSGGDLPLFGDLGGEMRGSASVAADPQAATPVASPRPAAAKAMQAGYAEAEPARPGAREPAGARRAIAVGAVAIALLAVAILAGSALWGRGGDDSASATTAATDAEPGTVLAAIDGRDRAEIEAVVEAYLLDHPEIIPRALDRLQQREAATAIARLRPAIERPFAGAWGGNAAGDVVITEYSDFACGFCRQSLPDVERLLKSDPQLKIVYRELPILTAQSGPAAKVGLAAARKGRYRDYHLALFALRQPNDANILAAAKKAGMTAEDVESAKADPALDREIASNVTVAQQLRFEGTPTFVVGDQILHGAVGYDALKAAVAKARKSKNTD